MNPILGINHAISYPNLSILTFSRIHIPLCLIKGLILTTTLTPTPTTPISIDFVILFAGQYAEFLTNQTNSFGSHRVAVISLGNAKITGTFNPVTEDTTGLWWISLLGTGAGGELVRPQIWALPS